nr:MAG TPA: hypothetical protein [Caudoviricetes sp.]
MCPRLGCAEHSKCILHKLPPFLLTSLVIMTRVYYGFTVMSIKFP